MTSKTKNEIVQNIADSLGLSHRQTKNVVQKTLDAVIEMLVENGRVELRNFGIFEAKKRPARKAHNPKTGKKMDVPEKYVVRFKPGKIMEEQVAELIKTKKK
jgi:nucleoid DNA-binding protein